MRQRFGKAFGIDTGMECVRISIRANRRAYQAAIDTVGARSELVIRAKGVVPERAAEAVCAEFQVVTFRDPCEVSESRPGTGVQRWLPRPITDRATAFARRIAGSAAAPADHPAWSAPRTPLCVCVLAAGFERRSTPSCGQRAPVRTAVRTIRARKLETGGLQRSAMAKAGTAKVLVRGHMGRCRSFPVTSGKPVDGLYGSED